MRLALQGQPPTGHAANAAGGELLIDPSQMGTESIERTGRGYRLLWRGHGVVGQDFAVMADLEAARGGWDWSFSFGGNDSGYKVYEVQFPVVTVPRSSMASVCYPQGVGMMRCPDWDKLPLATRVVSSPCWAFHFAAILNDESTESWYCDQRGEAWRYPAFVEIGNGKTPGTASMAFSVKTDFKANLALPFGGAIRRFHGGWFEAASIYREWVRSTPRIRALEGRDRTKLRDTAIWFWNRGPEAVAVAPVERWVRETGLKTALDWYWWHAIPYDVGYPFFWPPREGEARFARAVKRLVEQGVLVQPYVNGVAWDIDDPSWERVSGEVCTFRDGKYPATKYNNFTPNRLTVMCSSSGSFKQEIRSLARRLHGAGVPALYLDQIGGVTDYVCYNRNHAHAYGDGTVMKDGYRQMLAQVRADNPGLLLATEDPSEAYLDRVDAFISLWPTQERFNVPAEPEARSIPVFQQLYHDLVTVFGSYAVIDGVPPWDPKWPDEAKWQEERDWTALYPDQFALEVARGVVIGQQPMVHQLRERHFTDSRFAGNFRWTVDTARFYEEHRDFLFDGTMLNPGRLDCDAPETKLFIRGIYTKVHEAREVITRPPAVLHGVWRAPDGSVAAILGNWTRMAQRYRLRTPDIASEGIVPARSWVKIEPKHSKD